MALLWFAGYFEKTDAQIARAEFEHFSGNARNACVTMTRTLLNDPGSAEWVGRNTWPVFENQDGTFGVQMTFRATNAFGGVVTERKTCRVRRDSRDAYATSVN